MRVTSLWISLVAVALTGSVVSSARAQVSVNAVQRAQQAREKISPTRPVQNSVPLSQPRSGGARNVTSRASIGGLSKGMQAFAVDTGRLPTTSESLTALLTAPPGVQNWRGPYVAVPSGRPPFTDPWGNLYQYTNMTVGNRQTYEIRSLGPDGVLSTRDDLFVQF